MRTHAQVQSTKRARACAPQHTAESITYAWHGGISSREISAYDSLRISEQDRSAFARCFYPADDTARLTGEQPQLSMSDKAIVTEEDRVCGALIGLACGDAVGTTSEFQTRGNFCEIKGMVGGGVFRLQPGEWTDDTSLALCLAQSLIEKSGHDPRDQLVRMSAWREQGKLSSNGTCFDVGNATTSSLEKFRCAPAVRMNTRDTTVSTVCCPLVPLESPTVQHGKELYLA